MIRCKICELEGQIADFKDGRGLNFHLKSKHNGMNLQEYKKIYDIENTAEKVEKEVEIPKIEQVLEEKSKEILIENKLPNVSNFQYVKQQYAVIFSDDDIREVIAIGLVELDSNSSVSVLVMDNTGHLIPPNWISEKFNIVNENIKKVKQNALRNKRKKMRGFKKFPKLKKDILKPKAEPADQASIDELIEKLMEFSKK